MKSSLTRCAYCGCVICTCRGLNKFGGFKISNKPPGLRKTQPIHNFSVLPAKISDATAHPTAVNPAPAQIPRTDETIPQITGPMLDKRLPDPAYGSDGSVLSVSKGKYVIKPLDLLFEDMGLGHVLDTEHLLDHMGRFHTLPVDSETGDTQTTVSGVPLVQAEIIEPPAPREPEKMEGERPPDEPLPDIILHRNQGEIGHVGYGLVAWTFSPMLAGRTFELEPGRLYIVRFSISDRLLVRGICLGISKSGCSMMRRQTGAGIYNSDGVAIAYTADQSESWEMEGVLPMRLARQVLLDPGEYDVMLLGNGNYCPEVFTGVSSPMVCLGLCGGDSPYSGSVTCDYIELPASFSQGRKPLEHSIWVGLF